jgi:hypothetical protein
MALGTRGQFVFQNAPQFYVHCKTLRSPDEKMAKGMSHGRKSLGKLV